MKRRVAVIGAGPSGVTAAKAALEYGLEPTVFESSHGVGGLWRSADGHVWPDMRTNLSKWTCAFSDYPWDDAADDFPLGQAVESYLQAYSGHFGVTDCIDFGARVESVTAQNRKWLVRTSHDKVAHGAFDGVVIASGAFAREFIPPAPGLRRFKGGVIHSAQYRTATPFINKRVAVVGASFSGIEIASHLASSGVSVVLLFSRPVWILPRYAPTGRGKDTAPLDLVLYRREGGQPSAGKPNQQEQNRRTARFFETTFGNPGDIHQALRTDADDTPPHVAISDSFLAHVSRGEIIPVRERLARVEEDRILTDSGHCERVDEIIFCTGYQVDCSFLPEEIRRILRYDESNKLVSHVADRTVMHPELPNIYLAGMYRGPYFGVIELQARWAAAMLAGEVAPPTAALAKAGLEREESIRAQRPRPQFPHGDYVAFADSIAVALGIDFEKIESPHMRKALTQGPVIPAQYRLCGPHAAPKAADGPITSACRRIGLDI